MNEIEQKLEALHLAESEYDAVDVNLKAAREAEFLRVMGEKTYRQFCDLRAEYNDLLERAASDRAKVVNELQAKIKDDTLQRGETVKAAHYMAVYSQPKPAWDNGKLEGFALVHPEILECRTEKPPYVSIRKVK